MHVLEDALMIANNDKRKLKVPFGCGGDRDRSKRRVMGDVAQSFSHSIFIAPDNSRSEDTAKIIDDIKDGVNDEFIAGHFYFRTQAIKAMITSAKPGDVLVIAGKGHEMSQIGNGYEVWFNDRLVSLYYLIESVGFQQTWSLDDPEKNSDVFISKHLGDQLTIDISI